MISRTQPPSLVTYEWEERAKDARNLSQNQDSRQQPSTAHPPEAEQRRESETSTTRLAEVVLRRRKGLIPAALSKRIGAQRNSHHADLEVWKSQYAMQSRSFHSVVDKAVGKILEAKCGIIRTPRLKMTVSRAQSGLSFGRPKHGGRARDRKWMKALKSSRLENDIVRIEAAKGGSSQARLERANQRKPLKKLIAATETETKIMEQLMESRIRVDSAG